MFLCHTRVVGLQLTVFSYSIFLQIISLFSTAVKKMENAEQSLFSFPTAKGDVFRLL